MADCYDPCDSDNCELCFGDAGLPPGCDEPLCDDGIEPCLLDSDCLEFEFCQTGCCVQVPT